MNENQAFNHMFGNILIVKAKKGYYDVIARWLTLPLQASPKLHRCKMTPNSSVFWHCVNFGLLRLSTFRWGCHSSVRRGPRTEHVTGLLQRKCILDSLCWRVLHCFSNQPVHIWLPRSVARKNNHRLGSCLLYTSPSPRDKRQSRMPSSA